MSDETKKETAMQPFVPQNLDQLYSLAKRLAQSSLIPSHLRGKPDDVAVILMKGQELGVSPLTSLGTIHVIEGKPGSSAELMAALVLRRPDVTELFRVVESTDDHATVEAKRVGWPDARCISYTFAQAKNAKLTSKANWQAHPAAMLRARAISAACHSWFQDVTLGLYCDDELDEIRRGRGAIVDHGEVIDVSPTDVAPVDYSAEAQRIVDRINIAVLVEEVRAEVPDIRKLPREYQLRIKPVYDARIAAIEAGEVPDPEPEVFEQPPVEESANVGASQE
jgi:hypothetical protein